MTQGYHEEPDSRTDKAPKHQAASLQGKDISNAEIVPLAEGFVGTDFISNKTIVYHGTNQKFKDFDAKKLGSAKMGDYLGCGFYFTSNKDLAHEYGSIVKEVRLDIKNPYIRTDKQIYWEMMLNLNESTDEEFFKNIRDKGHDGIIVTDREFGGNMKFPSRYTGLTEIIVFNSSQIKVCTNTT